MSSYPIRLMELNELQSALQLVQDVFMEFEAPDYTKQGVKAFIEFCEYNAIKHMIDDGILSFWVCLDDGKIVGVIAVKNICHICMLFVDKDYHRRGIGKRLFRTVLADARKNGNVKEITVNSSPYAVAFYHKLGFTDIRSEQTLDGIRFTPMVTSIDYK